MLRKAAFGLWTPDVRDSIMASNVKWLVNHLLPGQKVLLFAHNYHIASLEETLNMKHHIDNSTIDSVYSIGVYGLTGSMGFLTGSNYKEMSLIKPRRNFFVKKIGPFESNATFVPLSESNERWNSKKMVVVSGPFVKSKIVPAKAYNGIIVIRKISPSTRYKFN